MHIRNSIAACFIFSCSAYSQAADPMAELAQKLEGTIYVIPHRESADGVLSACGLEFAAMKRDFSTKQGAPVKIVGSFYLRLRKKAAIMYTLKLGMYDGFSSENGFAPHNAFIRAPDGKAPIKAIRVPAENAGFALFVGLLDDEVIAAYAAIAEKSQLVVGFNRKAGQQDVIVSLDLTVVDMQIKDNEVVRARSNKPVAEFMSCSGDLFEDAKSQ